MRLARRELWLAIVAVALIASFSSASASAVIVREPNGHSLGIAPQAGVNPTSIPGFPAHARSARAKGAAGDTGIINYNGGPVLHSSDPYLIVWDPTAQIPASSKALLERFFTDVAAANSNNVYGVIRQYYDSGGYANEKQTFSARQVITDTDTYPPQDTKNCLDVGPAHPTCLTDSQLQAELTSLIARDHLPTGLGPVAPIYFIVTPPNVNVCIGVSSCADSTSEFAFCAYHSFDSAGNALYAAIPMEALNDQPKGCQDDHNLQAQEPNGDGADVVLKYVGHEDAETITDPLDTAWYDDNTFNEIADECNATGALDPSGGTNPNAFLPTLGGSASGGTLYDQDINGHPYYLQSVWSNGAAGGAGCEMQPSAATLTAAFTASASPIGVGHLASFNASGSASSAGYSSVSWNFGDGSTPLLVAAPTTAGSASHAYRGAGRYTVTLSLVNRFGGVATASHMVIVGSRPSAKFRFAPMPAVAGAAVRFNGAGSIESNRGASLTTFVWNFGDGSASGSGLTPKHTYKRPGAYTVRLTVTDSLGLTAAKTLRIRVAPSPRIIQITTEPTTQGDLLLVKVSGPGTVSVGSKHVRLRRAGTATFTFAFAARTVKVTFVPSVGAKTTRTVKITP